MKHVEPESGPLKLPADLMRRLRRLWRVDLRDLRLAVNPRLRRPGRYLAADRTVEIREGLQDARHVLVHELAHAAAVELHGRNVGPHGKEWRALLDAARAAGLLTVRSEGGGPQRRTSSRRYRHTCPVCQFHRTAGRPVTTWRCPECVDAGLKGHLEIARIR